MRNISIPESKKQVKIGEVRFRNTMPDFDREIIPDFVPEAEWREVPVGNYGTIGIWSPGVCEHTNGGWSAYMADRGIEAQRFHSLAAAEWYLTEICGAANIYIISFEDFEDTAPGARDNAALTAAVATLIKLASFVLALALTAAPVIMEVL